MQRVLPNTAEFYNVINHLNGSANGEDGYDAALYAIFLEMPERHMAEQLTRLDTVDLLHFFLEELLNKSSYLR